MSEHVDRQLRRRAAAALRERPPHPNSVDVSTARVLALHAVAGNQAVQRLLGGPPAAVSIVQRDLSKKDAEVKKKVQDFVKDGKYDEALALVCTTYGFSGPNFEIKAVPAMADSWATTAGEIKAGAKQTLSIGKDLFAEDFVFIVRTIGHEFQHLKQRSQEKPITDQKEREFLAWAWEALDESVPVYELKVAATHAKKALEYYADMPEASQKRYLDKKAELEKLIDKAK